MGGQEWVPVLRYMEGVGVKTALQYGELRARGLVPRTRPGGGIPG